MEIIADFKVEEQQEIKAEFSVAAADTNNHEILFNRDKADQHPISAITGLEEGLNGKQDIIEDLEAIREGASEGATAVQPEDLATVATSGSYTDLTNKPTIPTTTDIVTASSTAALTSGGAYTALSNKVENSKVKNATSSTAGDIYDVTYINTMLGDIESLLGGI